MKILIISDIHGSYKYTNKIITKFVEEKFDQLWILGDIYYHGPRNSLPEEYNPMKVSEILNQYKANIIAIKGNCDAEVDEMISEFEFNQEYMYVYNNKKIYMTHGHKYNKEDLPEEEFDIMLYGHYHIPEITKINNKIFINPGSISLPKNNSKNTYATIENNIISLKSIDGEILEEIKI